MAKINTQKLIDSNELLDKCEITMPTLNYYIKLGIVPKPVVKSPEDGLTGYFPAEVIDIIDKVKQLKDEGETMGDIVRKVKDSTAKEYDENSETKQVRFDERTDNVVRYKIGADSVGLSLTLEDIQAPAYLLNYQFEIEWINEQAEEAIFGKKIRTIREVESRNVFRLFLNWEFSSFMKNCEEILQYHMYFFKARQQKEQIPGLYADISGKEVEYLQKVYDNANDTPMEKIHQQLITLVEKDRSEEQYVVYTIFYREGMFFLYLPANSVPVGITEYLSNRGTVLRELLSQRLPTLVSFSVFVADLQGSVRICAELPPEEYFELINSMRKLLEESFKKYHGIFGKCIGDGAVYYFLKKQDPDYIMNSIHCAIEIRKNMERFSSEWKTRKKWYNDLHLNIGINEGQEYFSTTAPSSTNIEFTALGDTINYAA